MSYTVKEMMNYGMSPSLSHYFVQLLRWLLFIIFYWKKKSCKPSSSTAVFVASGGKNGN